VVKGGLPFCSTVAGSCRRKIDWKREGATYGNEGSRSVCAIDRGSVPGIQTEKDTLFPPEQGVDIGGIDSLDFVKVTVKAFVADCLVILLRDRINWDS
jgi:hypothetical protein